MDRIVTAGSLKHFTPSWAADGLLIDLETLSEYLRAEHATIRRNFSGIKLHLSGELGVFQTEWPRETQPSQVWGKRWFRIHLPSPLSHVLPVSPISNTFRTSVTMETEWLPLDHDIWLALGQGDVEWLQKRFTNMPEMPYVVDFSGKNVLQVMFPTCIDG